jgi:hypothetical protein
MVKVMTAADPFKLKSTFSSIFASFSGGIQGSRAMLIKDMR